MVGCNYKILNDKGKVTQEFKSELELNEFLKNKKISNSFVLSASEKTNSALEKLKEVMDTARASHTKVPVTEFLTMDQIIDNRVKKLTPEYIKENRIPNTIKEYLANGRVILSDTDRINNISLETKAKNIITNIIDEEEQMGKFGSEVHKLLSILINKKRGQTYLNALDNLDSESFKDVLTKNISSTAAYDSKDIIDRTVTSIYNELKRYENDGWTILSEVPLSVENPKIDLRDGIKGVVDIILVDKNGVPHIYDLKISKNPVVLWDSAKKLHTDYQLSTYRQMLAANGFEVGVSSLNIIPITMKYGDITSFNYEGIHNRTAAYSGLSYGEGVIATTLKKLIPSPISKNLIKNDALDDKIGEDLNTILPGYTSKFKVINNNEQAIFDKYKGDTNEAGEFRYTLNGKTVYYKTEEDLRAAIKTSIQTAEDNKLSTIHTIQQQMYTYLNSKTYPIDLIGIKDTNPIVNNVLSINFERYTRGD